MSKTLVPVSSSFDVVDGFAYELDANGRRTNRESHDEERHYHCSSCGERGHSVRTCGRTAEERASTRH